MKMFLKIFPKTKVNFIFTYISASYHFIWPIISALWIYQPIKSIDISALADSRYVSVYILDDAHLCKLKLLGEHCVFPLMFFLFSILGCFLNYLLFSFWPIMISKLLSSWYLCIFWQSRKIVDNHFDKLSLHGIGKEYSSNWWKALGDQLITSGIVSKIGGCAVLLTMFWNTIIWLFGIWILKDLLLSILCI